MKQALNNQRGSVLIMGLLVLVVLGGMLAAASPMIVNEVKLNMVNRDMIDAQFTAEAGAKVGIAAVYAKNADWTWLGKPKNLTTAEANKTYSLEIVNASTNVVISGEPVSGTTYKITSTGTVNGISKKVKTNVNLSSISGTPPNVPINAADAALYAGGNVEFKNNGSVNNSSVSAGGNITGNVNVGGGYGRNPATSVPLPTFNVADYSSAVAPSTSGGTLTQPKYYIQGNWIINNNSDYASSSGVPVTIYVTGNIVLPQNVNFNGSFLLVAGGNIDGSNTNNVNFNGVVLVAGGNIDVKNAFNLNGNAIAGGNISFNNNANINYSTSLLAQFPAIPTSYVPGGGADSKIISVSNWIAR